MKPSEILPKKGLAERFPSVITQNHDKLRESFYSSGISEKLAEILFESIIPLDIINLLINQPPFHSTNIYKGLMVPGPEISQENESSDTNLFLQGSHYGTEFIYSES